MLVRNAIGGNVSLPSILWHRQIFLGGGGWRRMITCRPTTLPQTRLTLFFDETNIGCLVLVPLIGYHLYPIVLSDSKHLSDLPAYICKSLIDLVDFVARNLSALPRACKPIL